MIYASTRKIAFATAVLVVLGALVYGAVTWFANGGHATAGSPPPFAGAVNQFTVLSEPRDAPFGELLDRNGEPVDVSRFEGRVILLNFWATWCAPCVVEMPTLDALQGRLGGEDFQVVTVSVDRQGMDVVGPFWREQGFEHLSIFLDPRSQTYAAFGTRGLPTSFLIDHEGRVVGYLEGHAEWNSEAARALIQHYIDRARAS